MSDYVVHFSKPVPLEAVVPPSPPAATDPLEIAEFHARIRYQGQLDRSGYDPWISILGERAIRTGEKRYGAARRVSGIDKSQRVVCFSEIPLDMLERLIDRRSLYGLGFHKQFIVERGGAPLWYLDMEGAQAALIREEIANRESVGVDPADRFWRLTPFIDQPGDYPGRRYRFEWEREWRVVGDLHFHQDDVAFLFLPEEDHVRARQFFIDAESENTGPAYHCPYIDARWDMARVQAALTGLPEPPSRS